MKFMLLLLISFATATMAKAQHTLHGKITDRATGKELEGASVFVVELNKGTSTDEEGDYHISGIGKGRYSLKVTYLGYQATISEVRIAGGEEDTTLDIALDYKPLEIHEVVVSGAYITPEEENTYKIDVVKKSAMQATGAVTVMDIINKVPGVDAVTTGPLVSRPVVRGLSGNRVLSVVDGVRYEAQQWDDEHGIGVNELGLDRVEIIKGPSSLLYGPEAMGGVVHFVREEPAEVGTTEGTATASLYSNNVGAAANVSLKGARERYNWGVNALGKLLSDYFYDGYDFRVPNTRLLEYGGKGYVGLNREWGSSTLSYLFNKSYYGILDGKDIIRNEEGQLVNTDSLEKEKFPLEIEAPFHAVTDHRLNSKTTVLSGSSKIEAVLGYQNNHRSENEELSGSKKGYTYLDMILQSATYDLKWYLPRRRNFQTILGSQGMLQKNKNREGAATQLIPDANISDLGLLALTKWSQDALNISLGARYDNRHLKTDENSTGASGTMPGITRNYDNISSSVGLSYLFEEGLLLRAGYASGYRSPNLNELFSDGVKLETQRYELGNTDFAKERNNQVDVNLRYQGKDISLEGSAFWNSIDDFIYIAPTGNNVASNLDPDQTVPEYRFLQSDATIRGGEASLDIHPSSIAWAHFETRFSTLTGKRSDDDSYLPVMPPTKLYNTLYFNFNRWKSLQELFFNLGTLTAFKQSQVAENELETAAYTLLNAAMGTMVGKMTFTLTATNLLDKAYLDHLSRFRSYGIIGPGLNISLSVKVPIDLL